MIFYDKWPHPIARNAVSGGKLLPCADLADISITAQRLVVQDYKQLSY